MIKAKLFILKVVEPMMTFLSSIKEINNELATLGKLTSNEDLVTTTIHALPQESSITRGGTLGTTTFNQPESFLQ